jgi:hypothetical protein
MKSRRIADEGILKRHEENRDFFGWLTAMDGWLE